MKTSLYAALAVVTCLCLSAAKMPNAEAGPINASAILGHADSTGNSGIELVDTTAAGRRTDHEFAPIPLEAQVIALINGERAKQGVPPLVENTLITDAARKHSTDMATNDFFSHTGSDGSDPGQRMTAAGYDWNTYGENIAAGHTTAADVVTAWMNSTGHRANILNTAFWEIGVGYAYDAGSTYGCYWTADFGTCPSSPTPGPIPTVIPTPVPGTNCINLAASPANVAPGGTVTLAFTALAQQYGFLGAPLDVYVAAIRGPLVVDAPSTVDQALGGGAVYLFGPNMASAYLYAGSMRGPAFNGVVFGDAVATGSLQVGVPDSSAYAGTYVFAAALLNRATGQFVRVDLPVENSNSFSVN